jgi:hypothetical protein
MTSDVSDHRYICTTLHGYPHVTFKSHATQSQVAKQSNAIREISPLLHDLHIAEQQRQERQQSQQFSENRQTSCSKKTGVLEPGDLPFGRYKQPLSGPYAHLYTTLLSSFVLNLIYNKLYRPRLVQEFLHWTK